jgi:hypothetical protein
MRTIPIYVNLDELDMITICLLAARHHGGIAAKEDGSLVGFTESGAACLDELAGRLDELLSLEQV